MTDQALSSPSVNFCFHFWFFFKPILLQVLLHRLLHLKLFKGSEDVCARPINADEIL